MKFNCVNYSHAPQVEQLEKITVGAMSGLIVKVNLVLHIRETAPCSPKPHTDQAVPPWHAPGTFPPPTHTCLIDPCFGAKQLSCSFVFYQNQRSNESTRVLLRHAITSRSFGPHIRGAGAIGRLGPTRHRRVAGSQVR